MTPIQQGQVDDALAYMRGERPAPADAEIEAFLADEAKPRPTFNDALGCAALVAFVVVFWGGAIWCAVNGYGLVFVGGVGLLAGAVVLIGRRRTNAL